MSRFLNSSTNNNTTDDEEHRINLLFPKCKIRQSAPTSDSVGGESESDKCPELSNFLNSHLETSDSNANREKVSSNTRESNNLSRGGRNFELYIDSSQLARQSVVEFLGGQILGRSFPGRARRESCGDVRSFPRRKEGYHYNISNQRRSHNHNSCSSPCGIDLRLSLSTSKALESDPYYSSTQVQKTRGKTGLDVLQSIKQDADTKEPKKLDNRSNKSLPRRKMDFDNSTLDEDSGHFDNGTGSGSNGSTFSESNTPLSSGSGPGLLHDSRIEIAGGREIFSQNKIRVGRRGRGIVGGPTTYDYESHYFSSPSAGKPRRKVIPPGTVASTSPRYANKKSPGGNSLQGTSSSSSVWELQSQKKELPKQFIPAPRVRSTYRHYGSVKHNHKSGTSYGQMRSRQQSFPTYDYYSPNPNHPSFHNIPRERNLREPEFHWNSIPRVHSVGSTTGLTIKETMFGPEVTSVEKSVIYDEKGRVLSCDQRLRTLEPPPVKKSIVYEGYSPSGGDIVFDDIEDWREINNLEDAASLEGSRNYESELLKSGKSPPNPCSPQYKIWDSRNDNDEKRKLSYTQIMESSSRCPSIQVEGNTSPSGYESDEISASADHPKPNSSNENKRLIGNLPIAEYEGSPRRYGLYRDPPGAISMPNDLDLVDLSSGIQVSLPSFSSHNLEMTGSRSPESHQSTNSLGSHNPLNPRTTSPGSGNNGNCGQRMPGFPQRVLTQPLQMTCFVDTKKSPIPTGDGNDFRQDTENQHFEGVEIENFKSICEMSSSNSLIGIEADSNDRELSPYVPRDDSVPVLPSQEESPGSICRNSSEEEKTEAVVPADVNESLAYSREQCDYLYEFSETRKVLEEFFHPESRRSSHHLGAGTSPDFDELDYTLKRQNGNSYVGQRLAGEVYVVEESPKKPRRGGREVVMSLGIPSELDEGSEFGTSPRLITFHDVSRSSLSLASKSSQPDEGNRDVNDNDLDVETTSTNTETDLGETEIGHQVRHPRNYTLSPETTDCDSNELESEMSLDYEVSIHSSSRLGTTMPVLEDGLSSGNVSENDEEPVSSKHGTGEAGSGYDSSSVGLNPTLLLMKKQITEIEKEIQMRAAVTNQQATNNGGISTSFPGEPSTFLPSSTSFEPSHGESLNESSANANIKVHEVPLCDRRSNSSSLFDSNDPELEALDPMRPTPPPSPAPASGCQAQLHNLSSSTTPLRPTVTSIITQAISPGKVSSLSGTANGIHLSIPGTESKESISTHHTEPLKLISSIMTPPDSKEPVHRHKLYPLPKFDSSSFTSLLPKPTSLNMTTGNLCPSQDNSPQSELHESSSEERLGPQGSNMSPVWVPRRPLLRGDRNHHSNSSGFGLREPFLRKRYEEIPDDDADTDQETDRLLGQHRTEDDYGFYNEKEWKKTKLRSVLPSSATAAAAKGVASFIKPTSHVPVSLPSTNNHSSSSTISNASVVPKHLSLNSPTAESTFSELPLSLPSTKPQKEKEGMKKKRNKEDFLKNPSVLIEGVLFRARYLGSTQLISEGQPTKATRMLQAEEAVSRIKAPEGETQPSTEVDLFISTEKIMVLNTDLKEIMMDHALRTISYIADIGDLVVLMARRRPVPTDTPEELSKIHRPPKMICHVFESDEAQYIAQSIGQAFQVAYMEFLKANGIEDHSFVREMDYQEVLNSQEIFGDELQMFAKKELQKDVVVPKAKGEILGVVIVESGWGSMLPTVVIANLAPAGAAARCGQLNIGDQIIAINGVSLVGLPLSTCQTYIKNSKTQTVVKLTVVPCPPVVEVKIKRPDTKYQLGFSVQNGVICSLLRGGIAERGGVRVGHRIIEINNQSVVAVPHEKIVNLLATSVGEINMKTMPTSMFRLLTGQETPIYI